MALALVHLWLIRAIFARHETVGRLEIDVLFDDIELILSVLSRVLPLLANSTTPAMAQGQRRLRAISWATKTALPILRSNRPHGPQLGLSLSWHVVEDLAKAQPRPEVVQFEDGARSAPIMI